MKFTAIAWMLMCLLVCGSLYGLSDPGFELTRPQELPIWSGAHWVKGGAGKYSARIVADAAAAAEGKQFLRMENPQKGRVYVLGYPTQKFIAGQNVVLKVRCRGTGLANIMIRPQTRDNKLRPWRRTQLALVKLHDSHFYPIDFNMKIYRPCLKAEKRFGKTEKDVLFAGYISPEGKRAVPGLPVDVKASLYIRPGKKALAYVSNLGGKILTFPLEFNLKEYHINKYTALNGETGKTLDLSRPVTIKKHDFLLIELEKVK